MKKQRVAIVIPTYNENENIGEMIRAIQVYLPQALLVVVDDQSPDETGKTVTDIASKNSNVKLITNPKKNGRGAAVLTGFRHILKKNLADIIIEMDADFSHRPEELPLLIAKINQDTVVFASRYVRGGRIENWSLTRLIFSSCANWLIHFVLKLPLKDNTNGYRAYSRQALQTLLEHKVYCSSYLVLSETALILHRHNYIFIELPTIFPNRMRGKSNTSWKEAMKNLIELCQIKQLYSSECTCNARK